MLQKKDFLLILLTAVFYGLAQFYLKSDIQWIHIAAPEMILIFGVISFVFKKITFRLIKKLEEFRTQVLLVYLVVSFLLACTLAVVYIEYRMYASKVFAFNFFSIYFFFTTFDIYSLITNLRQISEDTLKDNKKSGEEL